MEEEILTIFEDIQVSKRNHKTFIKKLNATLNSEKTAELAIEIILKCMLDQTLIQTKSTAGLQRIVDFFGQFFAFLDDGMKTEAFNHLFLRMKATQKQVRQRACQIIEGFLLAVTENDIELECDLINDITSNLLIRLYDKIATVRTAAVNALTHLQNPEDKEDPVVIQLMELFNIDSTPSVRNSIAKALTLCDLTKDLLITRLKDISADVRVSILEKFCNDTDIRQFSKVSRVEIVTMILNDRNASVRNMGEKLLFHWFSELNYDLTKFLSYFGPVENEKTSLLVLSWLAEKVMNPNKSSSIKAMDSKKMEALKLLPLQWKSTLDQFSTVEFLWFSCRCLYAEKFLSKFQFQQFFYEMCPFVETNNNEEDGTNNGEMEKKCLEVFSQTNFENLKENSSVQMNLKYFLQLISFYYTIHNNRLNPYQHNTNKNSQSNNLLKEILQLLMNEEKINVETFQFILNSLWSIPQLKASNYFLQFLNEFTANDEELVLDQSTFIEKKSSEDTFDEDKEAGNTPLVGKKIRLLLLTQSILQNQTYQKPSLNESFQFVLSCLQQPYSLLRAYATTSLGIFCIYDKEIRAQYLRVIKQIFIGEFEEEIVLKNSFHALVDLCLTSGSEFTVEEKREIDNYLLKQLNQLVITGDDSADSQIIDDYLLLIMEGTVKLVFNGFSKDPALVSKLLQFFFIDGKQMETSSSANSSQNEWNSPAPTIVKMNQMLSIFLHSFLLNDESCFEIVRLSLPLFISNCVTAIRDERMNPDSLGKVRKSLPVLNRFPYSFLFRRSWTVCLAFVKKCWPL
jgi:hypothetical protein